MYHLYACSISSKTQYYDSSKHIDVLMSLGIFMETEKYFSQRNNITTTNKYSNKPGFLQ